jgi:hypothetical protein
VTDRKKSAETAIALNPRDPDFPGILRRVRERTGFSRFWAIGDVKILEKQLLGVLCSIRCPGRVIVQTYDLARALRDAGVPVIGSFHSPMEPSRSHGGRRIQALEPQIG